MDIFQRIQLEWRGFSSFFFIALIFSEDSGEGGEGMCERERESERERERERERAVLGIIHKGDLGLRVKGLGFRF